MNAAALKIAFPHISASCLAENASEGVAVDSVRTASDCRKAWEGISQRMDQVAISAACSTINGKDTRTTNPRKTPKLERATGDGALGKNQGEKANAGRLHIRFESVRKRLLDPDNIAEKWLLDALRFANIIQGDEPEKITLETTQRKCEKGEEEHTLIQIFQP